MFGKHKKVWPIKKENLLRLLSVEELAACLMLEHYLVGNSH